MPLGITDRNNLNCTGKKQISGFGLPPTAVTKIKLKICTYSTQKYTE